VAISLPSIIRSHPTAFAVYAVFGLQAFLFQAVIRLEQCTGLGGCSLSLAKDALWSLIWPVYWLGRFAYF
jgi:hypothetical protein